MDAVTISVIIGSIAIIALGAAFTMNGGEEITNLNITNLQINESLQDLQISKIILNSGINITEIVTGNIYQLIVKPLNSNVYNFEAITPSGIFLDKNRRNHTGNWIIQKRNIAINEQIILNISNASDNEFNITIFYEGTI